MILRSINLRLIRPSPSGAVPAEDGSGAFSIYGEGNALHLQFTPLSVHGEGLGVALSGVEVGEAI